MPSLLIAPAAERDIRSVLGWTDDHFGEHARLRYEALLIQAVTDVASNPELPGSNRRDEIGANARTYHLTHSKDRVARRVGRVKKPRHFLLYRVRDDGRVEIGRVLHDSMDLVAHLSPEYRADVEED